LIERAERQIHEDRDAVRQHAERIGEGQIDLRLVALGGGWIRNAPMRRHRLPRPHGAGLGCSVVAKGKDKIELRCVRSGEFTPALGAEAGNVEVHPAQDRKRSGMHGPLRLAAG
jgi:hypothetical protein